MHPLKENLSNNTDWLNLGEAADLLGVHPSTVRLWSDRGELHAHRTPGKHRRFLRSEVETWAAMRREEVPPSIGRIIVENALNQTRIQMASGKFGNATWYQHLDDRRKAEHREIGRRLMRVILEYIDNENAATMEKGEVIGREYERLGREANLTLSETANIFLYFRDFLYESVIETYQTSHQRNAHEWIHIHQRIAIFTNAVLIALLEAHRCER